MYFAKFAAAFPVAHSLGQDYCIGINYACARSAKIEKYVGLKRLQATGDKSEISKENRELIDEGDKDLLTRDSGKISEADFAEMSCENFEQCRMAEMYSRIKAGLQENVTATEKKKDEAFTAYSDLEMQYRLINIDIQKMQAELSDVAMNTSRTKELNELIKKRTKEATPLVNKTNTASQALNSATSELSAAKTELSTINRLFGEAADNNRLYNTLLTLHEHKAECYDGMNLLGNINSTLTKVEKEKCAREIEEFSYLSSVMTKVTELKAQIEERARCEKLVAGKILSHSDEKRCAVQIAQLKAHSAAVWAGRKQKAMTAGKYALGAAALGGLGGAAYLAAKKFRPSMFSKPAPVAAVEEVEVESDVVEGSKISSTLIVVLVLVFVAVAVGGVYLYRMRA